MTPAVGASGFRLLTGDVDGRISSPHLRRKAMEQGMSTSSVQPHSGRSKRSGGSRSGSSTRGQSDGAVIFGRAAIDCTQIASDGLLSHRRRPTSGPSRNAG